MSNSNTGLIIVVVVALVAIVFIGGFLLIGDFSGSKENEQSKEYAKSQHSLIEQELSNLRDTNFQLSMQLNTAQSELKALKSQQQIQQIQYPQAQTNDRKCSNLDDDYDSTKQDIRDKKDDIANLKDEIARRAANNETITALEDELRSLNNDLDRLENDLDDINDDLDRYNC